MKTKAFNDLKQANQFLKKNKGRIDANLIQVKNKILIEYKEKNNFNIFKNKC